ncbi:MAG: rSAM/selenodomain-associated transferase 2 [Rhodothermales bacterium]|jgi:rSAM/selenodomain-associated transferase 2
MSESTISVVVPVFNEAARVVEALTALQHVAAWHEIIVVDGGSTDSTVALTKTVPGCVVIDSERGRATQLNAGARQAAGNVFLFLHADVSLPANAREEIDQTLGEPAVVGGAFRTWTVPDGPAPKWSWVIHLADLRSRYSRLPYGDQAIFVTREAFSQSGGYPEQPLFEDLEFGRRLHRIGATRTVRSSVRVSARRFVARPIYYFVVMNLLPVLYALGVPTRLLRGWYGDVR